MESLFFARRVPVVSCLNRARESEVRLFINDGIFLAKTFSQKGCQATFSSFQLLRYLFTLVEAFLMFCEDSVNRALDSRFPYDFPLTNSCFVIKMTSNVQLCQDIYRCYVLIIPAFELETLAFQSDRCIAEQSAPKHHNFELRNDELFAFLLVISPQNANEGNLGAARNLLF